MKFELIGESAAAWSVASASGNSTGAGAKSAAHLPDYLDQFLARGVRACEGSSAELENAPKSLYFIASLPKHLVYPPGDNPVKQTSCLPRNPAPRGSEYL